MNTNEIRPGAATLERTETETAAALAGSASISDKYDNTRGGTIASILCVGKENAVTGREIRRILALKDARDVTARVEAERRGGVPICATCDSERPGYYLPRTPEELSAYNRSLRQRIKNVTGTLDAMERAFDDWTGTGQARLDIADGEKDGESDA